MSTRISLFARLKQLFVPFAEIAAQLKRLADLYEADLAARVVYKDAVAAPVRLLTEEPKESDTEVLWTGDEPPRWRDKLPGLHVFGSSRSDGQTSKEDEEEQDAN